MLWTLLTGAFWHDLPNRYPPYQTCHCRFQRWQRSGLLLQLLQRLAEDSGDRGNLDRSEAFVDALQLGEKRGSAISLTRRGKGGKIMNKSRPVPRRF
jgi:transposase